MLDSTVQAQSGRCVLDGEQTGVFVAITDNDEVTKTASSQPRAGAPSLAFAILFGFLGAWWASNKAKSLGLIDTKRYWITAAISTTVAMLASIVVPILVVAAISASIGGTTTSNVFDDPAVRAPLTGNSGNSPAAAAPASPTLETIISERTDSRATLCRTIPGVVSTGSKNDTVGAAYNAWYETMRQAGLRNDSRVLACAILWVSPEAIPEAQDRYKNLFPAFRPLDPAHQLTSIGVNTVAAAERVSTLGAYEAHAFGGEIGMTFADGHTKNMLLDLESVDGIWLAQNNMM